MMCLFKEQAVCVFPSRPTDLALTISLMGLKSDYPVIVLIGGDISEQQVAVTRSAIETLAKVAEKTSALVTCGGTDMDVMAEISPSRKGNEYKFHLVEIAPKELVAWSGSARSTRFLWWGKKRWTLAPNYSHFILAPGSAFEDESPWIVDVASLMSKDQRSVTILINGGNISRSDVELSVAHGRPVIALAGTGCPADELAGEPNGQNLITAIPANAKDRVYKAVREVILVDERSVPVSV